MKSTSQKLSIITCLLVYIFVLITLSGCSTSHNEGKVVLFSCMEESREASMIEHLNEKFPDYSIEIQHYSTGNCGAKLLAEGVETEADIVVGLQCASLETVLDSLADVSVFKTAAYDVPQLNPSHGKYWIWEKYDGGFAINTDVLTKEGLPVPHSYEDLLNEAYKGWIVMPSPQMSGTGYMFLNNWYNMWGEEEAYAYVDKLQQNISQFVSSGHNVTQLVVSGENAIGLIDMMNIYKQAAENDFIEIVIPDSGAPFNITGTTIIKGKENKKAVSDVYSYLMGEYVVYDNSHFSPGGVFSEQSHDVPGYPKEVPLANMDTIKDIELKEYLTENWKY